MTRPTPAPEDAHAIATLTGVTLTQCTEGGEVSTSLATPTDRVHLHVRQVSETGTFTAALDLDPNEAIDLATDLLMMARAATWDGDL